MDIICEEKSEILFARVEAERIDAAAALQFKEAMREKTGASRAAHVVLDLSHVEFIDSSGLGAIVAVMKLLGNTKRLDLAGLTPTVEKVFRLTRMDSIFTIYPDVSDALDLHRAG
jgi:anti-sigma B factor antagonist